MSADRIDALRSRLIDAAEAELAEHGPEGLKARAITRRAGCALGALYKGFDDLGALALAVNARTLTRLGDALTADLPHAPTPEALTQALAGAYLDFALANRNLWLALFDLPGHGPALPDWYRQHHQVLLARIIAPLGKLRPDLPPERMLLRIRTLFGAVHGVVHLSLRDTLIGVPQDALRDEIAALVTAMTLGARQVAEGDGGR